MKIVWHKSEKDISPESKKRIANMLHDTVMLYYKGQIDGMKEINAISKGKKQ